MAVIFRLRFYPELSLLPNKVLDNYRWFLLLGAKGWLWNKCSRRLPRGRSCCKGMDISQLTLCYLDRFALQDIGVSRIQIKWFKNGNGHCSEGNKSSPVRSFNSSKRNRPPNSISSTGRPHNGKRYGFNQKGKPSKMANMKHVGSSYYGSSQWQSENKSSRRILIRPRPSKVNIRLLPSGLCTSLFFANKQDKLDFHFWLSSFRKVKHKWLLSLSDDKRDTEEKCYLDAPVSFQKFQKEPVGFLFKEDVESDKSAHDIRSNPSLQLRRSLDPLASEDISKSTLHGRENLSPVRICSVRSKGHITHADVEHLSKRKDKGKDDGQMRSKGRKKVGIWLVESSEDSTGSRRCDDESASNALVGGGEFYGPAAEAVEQPRQSP